MKTKIELNEQEKIMQLLMASSRRELIKPKVRKNPVKPETEAKWRETARLYHEAAMIVHRATGATERW